MGKSSELYQQARTVRGLELSREISGLQRRLHELRCKWRGFFAKPESSESELRYDYSRPQKTGSLWERVSRDWKARKIKKARQHNFAPLRRGIGQRREELSLLEENENREWRGIIGEQRARLLDLLLEVWRTDSQIGRRTDVNLGCAGTAHTIIVPSLEWAEVDGSKDEGQIAALAESATHFFPDQSSLTSLAELGYCAFDERIGQIPTATNGTRLDVVELFHLFTNTNFLAESLRRSHRQPRDEQEI